MKKTLFFFLTVFCACLFLFPERLSELPEISKYPRLFVDEENFYIRDGNTNNVHIYSKANVKHCKTFSKQSEGPGEFRLPPTFMIYSDFLYMMEQGKICSFSKNGIFRHRFCRTFYLMT